MLGLLGLTMVGSLSGRSVLKGMTAARLGLLLSPIGYAEQMAIPRYWLNTTYLLDGLPLVPVVLGCSRCRSWSRSPGSNRPISDVPRARISSGGILAGMRDCSSIGGCCCAAR